MYFLKLFLIAVPIFFAIDLLWLGVIAKGIYGKYLGHLMRDTPIWSSAIVFYLLFIVGMIIFVINPAMEKNSVMYAVQYGALFGFMTYMTYELTNYAVIKDWPWQIIGIDILWGVILSASVSALTVYLAKLWL